MAAYTPQYMLRTAMAGSNAGSSVSGSASASTRSGATTASAKSKGSLHEVVKAIMASGKSHDDRAAVILKLMAGGGGRKAKRKRRTPLELTEAEMRMMKSSTLDYYKALAGIQAQNHSDYLELKIKAEHKMLGKKSAVLQHYIKNKGNVKPVVKKGEQLSDDDKTLLKAFGALNRLEKRMAKLDPDESNEKGLTAILKKYSDKNKFLNDVYFASLQPILKRYYEAKYQALNKDDTKARREALRAALVAKKKDMAAWRTNHDIPPRQKPPKQIRQSLAFEAGLFDLHESCEDTDDDDY